MDAKWRGLMALLIVAGVWSGAEASVVVEGAKVVKLAGGFAFTEGPAADAQGNIFFSDIPNNRIHKWSLEGKTPGGKLSTFRENSGGANGLYFDKNGNLLACEGGGRRLVSIDPKGNVTVLADKYEGKRFNSPNDLWIDPKGGVYFTDPRYGGREGMEQDGEHVYYLSPDRKKLTRVVNDLVRPNGVIGTPDGKTLYVADHGGGKIFVYKINENSTLSDRKLFAPEGSDGMTIDGEGNVYLTTKVVAVYNKAGEKIEEIQVPEQPANVTFGGSDNQTLFITARTSLYVVDMAVSGARVTKDQAIQDDPPIDVKPLTIGYAGYWTVGSDGTPGREMARDPKGRPAILEYKADVEWDKDGKLISAADSFTRIMTAAENKRWYKITDARVESGILVITVEEGIYTKFTEGRLPSDAERPLIEAKITEDGKWKGKASFFVTGFAPMGGATIYQDTRNYRVTREQSAEKSAEDKATEKAKQGQEQK